MDKITNNTFNNMNKHISKDRENLGKVSFIKSESKINVSESKINVVDLKYSKVMAANLAKSAPIDADKVSKIKEAISAGNYPLDLDKVSDALMQAYREMKS